MTDDRALYDRYSRAIAGQPLPSAFVDLDAFDANITQLVAPLRAGGKALRSPDMPTCLETPRLVELMLARRWSPTRIRNVLGGNFLRALDALRPPGWS